MFENLDDKYLSSSDNYYFKHQSDDLANGKIAIGLFKNKQMYLFVKKNNISPFSDITVIKGAFKEYIKSEKKNNNKIISKDNNNIIMNEINNLKKTVINLLNVHATGNSNVFLMPDLFQKLFNPGFASIYNAYPKVLDDYPDNSMYFIIYIYIIIYIY